MHIRRDDQDVSPIAFSSGFIFCLVSIHCSKESGINIFPEREIKKKVATEHSGDPNIFFSTEYHHTM